MELPLNAFGNKCQSETLNVKFDEFKKGEEMVEKHGQPLVKAVKDKEDAIFVEETGWQHWYLAIILGGVLLFALVITLLVLLRFSIQANVLSSLRREVNNVNMEMYQIGNDPMIQPSALNTFHNNAFDTDENLIFDKAEFTSETKTASGVATSVSSNCINDYLYLCSGTLSSSCGKKARVSSVTSLEVNSNKNKQRKHKHNKQTDQTGHHYTDLTEVPLFTKQNKGPNEGLYAVSSCFNEQFQISQLGSSKSTPLAEEMDAIKPNVRSKRGFFPRSHSSVDINSILKVKGTDTTSFCNLQTALNTRREDNEYEEIDTSHLSQPYQSKAAPKHFPSVARKSLRSSRLWLRTTMTGAETREDDGGYLVPSVLTMSDPNIHKADTGYTSFTDIYVIPHIENENRGSTRKIGSLFKAPVESSEHEKPFNDAVPISRISFSSNAGLSDYQDDDMYPIYSTPKDYNSDENSTEQMYANSIYVNSNVHYNDIDHPHTSPPE